MELITVALFFFAGVVWLIMGAKRSRIKRGILAALVAWSVLGLGPPGVYFAMLDATQRGNITLIKAMLDLGVDPNCDSLGYGTVLTIASSNGNEAIARLLLERGADPNKRNSRFGNPLFFAAQQNHVAIMNLLFQHGAGERKDEALWAAAARGRKEALLLLLAHGANPNQTTPDGKSLAELAIERGHPEIAPLLRRAAREHRKR